MSKRQVRDLLSADQLKQLLAKEAFFDQLMSLSAAVYTNSFNKLSRRSKKLMKLLSAFRQFSSAATDDYKAAYDAKYAKAKQQASSEANSSCSNL